MNNPSLIGIHIFTVGSDLEHPAPLDVVRTLQVHHNPIVHKEVHRPGDAIGKTGDNLLSFRCHPMEAILPDPVGRDDALLDVRWLADNLNALFTDIGGEVMIDGDATDAGILHDCRIDTIPGLRRVDRTNNLRYRRQPRACRLVDVRMVLRPVPHVSLDNIEG